MRILFPLAALALVTACNKSEPEPVATDTEAAAPVAMEMPAVAPDARTTLNYAGIYSQSGADGAVTSLKINTDDTYEWTAADGAVTKGTYSWYKDGSRVLLDEAGGKAVYAVADGAVYKLADKDAPLTGFTADQMYSRGAM